MYDSAVGPIKGIDGVRKVGAQPFAGLPTLPAARPQPPAQPEAAERRERQDRIDLSAGPGSPRTYAQFSVDDKTHIVTVKIHDAATNEVIQEIPSERMVRLAQAMRAYLDTRGRGGR